MDKFIYACFILQLSSINHHNCIMQRDGFIHMGTELWRIRKLRFFFSTEFSRKYFWDYHQYLTLSLQIFQHPSIPSLQVTYDLPS